MRWRTRQQHERFQIITRYLRALPAYVAGNTRVRDAFAQYSGLQQQALQSAITLGDPPLFQVAPITVANANGSYNRHTRLITIELDIASEIEAQNRLDEGTARVLLYSICLHELVHFGRHVSDLPARVGNFEAGKMFECQAYQGDLNWDGSSSRLRQSRNGVYNGTPWACPLSTLTPGASRLSWTP